MNNHVGPRGKGNWKGNLNQLGGTKGKNLKRLNLQSNKGFWKLAFADSYEDITETDVDLRRQYGKSILERYLGTRKEIIQLRKKDSKQTVTSLHEVYYVRVGEATLGKMGISVQRSFGKINLHFTFQEKLSAMPTKRGNNSKRTKNQKQAHKRQSQKRKKTY